MHAWAENVRSYLRFSENTIEHEIVVKIIPLVLE